MSQIFPFLRVLRSPFKVQSQTLVTLTHQLLNTSPVAVTIKAPTMIVDFRQPRRWKADDRRTLIASMPIKDMGTQGEKELDIDVVNINKDESLFPDADTPNQIFNGIKFSEIPICHIKATKNNTILHVADPLGKYIFKRTCGQEGFKNARRGTNIAAQSTAISLANTILSMGVSTIRIAIQGLGPGRISSVKGLQMAGLKIVAIADTTPVTFQYRSRARKARRL